MESFKDIYLGDNIYVADTGLEDKNICIFNKDNYISLSPSVIENLEECLKRLKEFREKQKMSEVIKEEPVETTLYLIKSPHHNGVCGNCVTWWGKERKGYTCNIMEAGLYSKQDTIDILRDARGDVAYPAEQVMPLIVQHVDIQDLSRLVVPLIITFSAPSSHLSK